MLRIENGIVKVNKLPEYIHKKLNYYYETYGYINTRKLVEERKDSMSCLNINISSKCNMNCSYCYHKHTTKTYDCNQKDELNFKAVENILDCNPKITEFAIAGKESLLKYDDIIKLIRLYPNKKVTLFTNFININKLPEDIIYNKNVEFMIGIELEGGARKTYNGVEQYNIIKDDIKRIAKNKLLNFNIPYGYYKIDPIETIRKMKRDIGSPFLLSWHFVNNFTDNIDNSENYKYAWQKVFDYYKSDEMDLCLGMLLDNVNINKISQVYKDLLKDNTYIPNVHNCSVQSGNMALSPNGKFSYCAETLDTIDILPPDNTEESKKEFMNKRYDFMKKSIKSIFDNNICNNFCKNCQYRIFCIEPCKVESECMNRCEVKNIIEYQLTLVNMMNPNFIEKFNEHFWKFIKTILLFDKELWQDIVINEKEDVIQWIMKKL